MRSMGRQSMPEAEGTEKTQSLLYSNRFVRHHVRPATPLLCRMLVSAAAML